MVKMNFFARWGIVRFVRGWYRRRRFLNELNWRDRLNKENRGKYIVVNYNNEPLLINKVEFKRLLREGVFCRGTTWGKLCNMQIERENLQ